MITNAIGTRRGMLALAAGAAVSMVAVATPAASAQEDGQDLDLRRLTLYRSGVGSFERRGLIDGNADVDLKFDADQINDILKSMILLDLDGGQIGGVDYGSREPLSRRLSSFAIDLSNNPSTAGILAQLRGAQIRVETMDRTTIEGSVLGVERREEMGEGVTAPRAYLNLAAGGIRSVPIENVRNFTLLDEELAAELDRALLAIAEQRSENVKSVGLSFRGSGTRRVAVSYVHEMPVWKASYRLVLPDDAADAGEAEDLTVQGWAIVENTTDEDWEDIELSLVSGQPVSFVMDLYQPLFLDRPVVPVPAIAAAAPTVYARGRGLQQFSEAESEVAGRSATRGAGGVSYFNAPTAPADGLATADFDSLSMRSEEIASYAPRAQATAGESGEVFTYTLDQPVTIERRRSAMLPILTSGLEGRRVSVYSPLNPGNGAHPLRGVEVENTSGLELMPGPVSVLDGGAYAGDAQIGFVGVGETRLLTYAVDLEVSVNARPQNRDVVERVSIVDGVLRRTIGQERSVTYEISNADADRDRLVIVEHPRAGGGWVFEIEGAVVGEETDRVRRCEVEVAAGEDAGFKVTESRTTYQSFAVVDADLNQMLSFRRSGKASQAVVDAIKEAQRLQSQVREAERAIENLDRERGTIVSDQSRIRENIKTLPRDSDLYSRSLTKLSDQETRLDEIGTERGDRQRQLNQRRAALRAYLRDLDID